jgi:hypothetical protein
MVRFVHIGTDPIDYSGVLTMQKHLKKPFVVYRG